MTTDPRTEQQLRHQLSHAFRAAVEAEGISQAEIARMTGMSAKHVNQMVTGAASATVMTWEFAAYALGYRWHVSLEKDST